MFVGLVIHVTCQVVLIEFSLLKNMWLDQCENHLFCGGTIIMSLSRLNGVRWVLVPIGPRKPLNTRLGGLVQVFFGFF
jgi:hypothetical protein